MKNKILIKQEFDTSFGTITLKREGELCYIIIQEPGELFHREIFLEKNRTLLLTVDQYKVLFYILRDSQYIFSKENQ